MGRCFCAGIAAVTLIGTSIAGALPGTSAATPPSIRLTGPSRAPLGATISFRLVADAPRAIGAFSANLRFDHRALEVVRISTPHTLPGTGALTPLSAVETPDRKVIAGWTCTGGGCAGASPAASGAVHRALLATIDVQTLRPGAIELRIDGGLLVDAAGGAIGNVLTHAHFSAGSAHVSYRAPGHSSYSIAARASVGHAHRSADVNRDGRVTPLDVSALTQDWVRGAESGASCPAADRGDDVNGDGCMTIADLQTVASAISATPRAPSPMAVHTAATLSFTVNSTGDGADATSNGICQTSTVGECTLRAALQEANSASVPVSISFSIPGSGIHTIAPGTRLPALNNPNGITIDGFTQPGSSPNTDPLADNAVYDIELIGTGGTGIDGLFVSQANNVIRGLNMHAFNRAIWIYGSNATNNLVEGNMLGLTPTGALDPTYQLVNSATCIVIQQGASYAQIGAPGVANRNVVSGCDHQDIATYDYPTNHVTIQNNITGLDPTGTQRRAAKSHGIDINTGTEYTLIGGADPSMRNVSSGNSQEGVEISHNPLTKFNSIIGNFIGTDLTGNNAYSYTQNGQWGVHGEGDPTCNNAACNLDMGYATITNNVIVNSQRGGLLIDKGVHDSTIANNKIGVTANGTPAGNLLFGVNIQAGSVRITFGPGNEVANNANGVQMESDGVEPPNSTPSPTNQNTITQNSIHGNGANGVTALGIDLAPFGQVNTAVNADPNVNDAMIAPVLSNPTTTTLDVATCANCTVELFVADQPAGSFGSGQTYLQSVTADANGAAQFAIPANENGDVVTATATNTSGSTSEFSKNVLIPGSHGNSPPTAAFTYSCTGLKCSFDGSTSTDSDGNIVSYNWNFGDSSPGASGAMVQHTFTSANTYTVTLTVTDNGGASTPVAHDVTVTDLPPTAAFTGSCNQLVCSFDGTSSTDPDNGISSYSWDFGDSSPLGSGATVQHTYSASGQYTVKLTVDDGQGGTNSTSQVFNVSGSTVVASDTFTRSVASGWGNADVGGAYAAAPGTTSGSTSVNGSAGAMTLTATPSGRGYYLPGASVLNSDSVVDVSTSAVPAGGSFGQASYITERRVSSNTEYRLRVRFAMNNSVHLTAIKTVGSATETVIGSDVTVAGLTNAAGKVFRVRFDVTGTSPTKLRAKVWLPSGSEPANWQLNTSDSEAALQAAGNPGLRAFLGASASNTPTWLFDNFAVTDLTGTNLPPNASFTGSCTKLACSFDGTASSDPDNGISTYSWNFGDGSPAGSGATANHTYAKSGIYTVTLTVTDGGSATDAVSHQFSPTNVVASDLFTRSVSSGWGSANVGGAYSAAAGTTSGSTSVNGTTGLITLNTAATGRGFYLPSVSVLNSDTLLDVSTSAVPAGGTFGQAAYITARRVSSNTEYRLRVRIAPNNAVHLTFLKTVGSTTENMIGSDVTVSGLTNTAGKVFRVRVDVTGTNPTTLKAKVWAASSAEPASWQLTTTDSQAALQVTGNPGVRAFLGASSTNSPTFRFDNFTVAAL